MMNPEEYEAYLKHCEEAKAEEQRNQEKEQRKREEAEAEERRRQEEAEENLKKRSPWAWKRLQEERKEAARKKEEAEKQRQAETDRRLKIHERGDAWAKSFETETLEDIADEILKVDADPSYILKFMEAPSNLNRLWIKRIMSARLRQKGGRK